MTARVVRFTTEELVASVRSTLAGWGLSPQQVLDALEPCGCCLNDTIPERYRYRAEELVILFREFIEKAAQ